MATTLSVDVKLITDQRSISSYNRGPITSVFAAPPSCTATLSFTSGSRADLYFGHWGSVFDNLCFPTGANSARASAQGEWQIYYYSPAICPAGWTATRTFQSSMPAWPFPTYLSLGPETTGALCCPSGWSYYRNGHQCSSTITAGQNVVMYSYKYDGQAWDRGSPTTFPFLQATTAFGDGVPIMWQNSDSSLLAQASAMTPTAQVTTGGTSPTNTAQVTNETALSPNGSPSTGSPSSGGLSTGAKIGIGVGIPVVVIIGLVIGFLLWRRRRGRQTAAGNGPAYLEGVQGEKYKHAPITPTYGADPYCEMPTAPENQANLHELPDTATTPKTQIKRHELPDTAKR